MPDESSLSRVVATDDPFGRTIQGKHALLDTNRRAKTPKAQARRAAQVARARAGDPTGVMREDMDPMAWPHARTGQPLPMALPLGPKVFARQSRTMKDRSDQATLAAGTGPALVLMGPRPVCPPGRHRLMHHLVPQSRLHILPGAAHLQAVEHPTPPCAPCATGLPEGPGPCRSPTSHRTSPPGEPP